MKVITNPTPPRAGQRRQAELACTCRTAPGAFCLACGYFNRVQRVIDKRASASWGGLPQ